MWKVLRDDQAQNVRAERYATYYAEQANERIQRLCMQSSRPALLECVRKEVDATREAQRSEYDLAAQQGMSNFAFWALCLGVGQIALATLGYFALIRTLEQNEDALQGALESNKIANDAVRITQETAKKQLRAYLHVSNLELKSEHVSLASALFWVKNYGATPARNVLIRSMAFVGDYPFPGDLPDMAEQLAHKSDIPQGEMHGMDIEITSLTQNIGVVTAGKMALYLIVHVDYEDIDGIPYVTRAAAFMTGKDLFQRFRLYSTGNDTT
jgi:hypothetical protein